MAKFKKNLDPRNTAIVAAVAQLNRAKHDPQYASLYNDPKVAEMVSMESLSEAEQAHFDTYGSQAEALLNSGLFTELESIYGEISKEDIEAAKILLAASSNLRGYVRSQVERPLDGLRTMNMESLYQSPVANLMVDAEQDLALAMESFDEKQLNQFLNFSIIYNVLAKRQDEANALLYKPLTVTPDDTGYRVSIRVEKVWNGKEHDPSESGPSVFEKRNLIDALVHPEVLETNATSVIPYYQKSVSGGIDNSEAFVVVPGKVEPETVLLEDVPVKTAFLKVNAPHNLLKLSSHPSLIAAELMNEKDSLDSKTSIAELLLKVNEDYVRVNVENLYTTNFYKTPEGHHREMFLNMHTSAYRVKGSAKTFDGKNDVALFKEADDAGYRINLLFRLTGSLNVETANIDISAMGVRIASVTKNGKRLPTQGQARKDDSTLDALLTKFETNVSIVGYRVDSRRTNYNMRTRGRLIDSVEHTEQCLIPLRAPISLNKPILGGDKEYPDVAALVNATRIQANNDGIATLVNTARILENITDREDFDLSLDRESFPGIGRWFIEPCFLKAQWHLPTMINSVQSGNRLEDIQGAVSTALNELVGRILKKTNYIPVVEQLTGGNPGKVKVAMVTDYRLPQYIMVKGDTRLFGGKVDYEIASTPNKLVSNKIYLTLIRENSEEGPDPFSFGTFLWMPELIVSQTITRLTSTYNTHFVQPRYMHVVNVPILAEIEITGIEEVTNESTVLLTSSIDKADLPEIGNNLDIPNPVTQATPSQVSSGKKKD